MFSNLTLLVLLPTLLAICGCTTPFSQPDWATFCMSSDWRDVGQADGAKGQSLAVVRTYKEKCGDNFTVVEAQKYQTGYLVGIIKFCTYEKGYEVGYGKGVHPESCPEEIASGFDRGFSAGKTRFHSDKTTSDNLGRDRVTERSIRYSTVTEGVSNVFY